MNQTSPDNQNSHLPKGWVLVTVKEISQKIVDGTHHTPTYTNDGVPFISVKDIRDGRISFDNCKFISPDEHERLIQRCKPELNDILITKSGTIGRIAVIKTEKDFSLFVSVALIKPYKDYFDSDFLALAFEYYISTIDIKQDVKGGVIKNLHLEDIREIQLLLPPLPEQERIVLKIEELFTKLEVGVAELKQAQAQLKRYRQAVLKSAVTGELTRDWREANQLNLIEWKIVCLKNYATQRLGKMLDKTKNVGFPTPYLRNINVRWFSFDLSNLFLLKITDKEKEELEIQNGDLLICEGGEPGRCAVWKLGETNIVFQKAIHRVRTNEKLSPYFLSLVIKNDVNTGKLEKYFTGTTIKHLTGRELVKYEFSLPPLAEQEKIVEEVERLLSVADAVEKTITESLKQAERLRQSILQKAFTGKLVPQDERDEPASVLLERIRHERDAETRRRGDAGKNPKSKNQKPKAKDQKPKTKEATQGNLPF